MADSTRILVYAAVVVGLAGLFLLTAAQNGFRLPEDVKGRVAATPATTVSKFHRHLVAGLFHDNLAHIGFNLVVFSVGYWLATQRATPFLVVGTAYGLGILTVFLTHLFLVLPLARLGVPYAEEALHLPLVGFSVIAYATLGAGLHVFPPPMQLMAVAGIVLFEVAAAIFVTGPFISVYHVAGLGFGFYVRSLST